ncbi:hypothetical protein, partial [Facklamia hominis]|uniref:hypothetical protein n=1 Tax=Facklamia hominis TaxID=178214 RepID=UPI0010282BA3
YSLAELERIYTQLLADVFTEIDLIDQPLELDQVAPFSSLEPIECPSGIVVDESVSMIKANGYF